MIGTFLPPRPDETIYSMCAEYQELLGAPSARIVNENFFGMKMRPLLAAFPRRLEYLEKRLPPSTGITAAKLLDEHTLLPYIRPFMREQQANEFVNGMKGDGIGKSGNKIFGAGKLPRALRFCPLCAVADREDHRGAYWHRIHQIPGILVCPHHKTLLEEIRPSLANQGMSISYLLAENAVPANCRIRFTNKSDPWHALQIWLSEQALWLLENPCPVLDCQKLAHFYRAQLVIKGFDRLHTRQVKNFVRALKQKILPEWIQALGWSPQIRSNLWVYKALNQGRGHVLQHLLILYSMDVTIGELVCQLGSEQIFEAGPWPCLNPECQDYGKAVIESYQLWTSVRGNLNADFACECGFTYRRRGPDRDGNSRFSPLNIVATGSAWASRLEQMWVDPAISISVMSKRLHVTRYWALAEGIRLGLPQLEFRRPMGKPPLNQSNNIDYREKNRKALIGCLKEHPDATRTDLTKLCSWPIIWLRKKDTEWFLKHYPQKRKSKGVHQSPAIDWEEKDENLASEIYLLRARLLKLPGCPIRITATRLKRMSQVSTYLLSKKHLGKAQVALKACVESDQSFALRQIQWFAMRDANVQIQAIFRRVRIRDKWLHDPIFCAAVKEILVRTGREVYSAGYAIADRAEDLADDTVRMNVQGAA